MGGFERRWGGGRGVLEVLLGMLVEMMHAFCVAFVLGACVFWLLVLGEWSLLCALSMC